MTAAALVPWAIEAVAASAALIAVVLLIRVSVRRAFGAQIAYALWALPLLRLVLPPLPAAWHAAAAAPIEQASERFTVLIVDPITVAAAAATPVAAAGPSLAPSLGAILATVWAVGAAGFLVWHLARHTLFCRRLLGSADIVERRAGVSVIASDAAQGPLAFGVVRRYVAFPRDFDARYDAEERALALAHEIGHHERGDLVANWAALVVLAIHWFNPLAWHGFRVFRADQELANDARVLAGRSALERHAYACAIIKAAHGGAVSAACHLHTISDLKGRLKMLKTSRASRSRLAAGGALVSVLVVAGLGLTASGTSAAAALTSKVETAVGGGMQAIPPAPPVPPTPAAAVAAPVPQVPPVPPVPSALRTGHRDEVTTTTTTRDGKVIHKRVIRLRDGKPIDYSEMPEVRERACGRGDEKQFVIHDREGKQRVMIICTDRIAKAAEDGAKLAANSHDIQRHALASALAGLRSARAGIEADPDMPAEGRAEALAGIDEGIAEVQADIAKPD